MLFGECVVKRKVSGNIPVLSAKEGARLRMVSRVRSVGILLFLAVMLFVIPWKLSTYLMIEFNALFVVTLLGLVLVGLLMFSSRVWMVLSGVFLLGFLLSDSFGRPLWMQGALLWVLGGGMTFLLTLSGLSRFVAPPLENDKSGSYTIFVQLVRHAFRDLSRPKPFQHLPPNLPKSFSTIGVGFVPSDKAIVINKGADYLRTATGGYTALQPKQMISQILELIPQSYRSTFPASTRDGIGLEANAAVSLSLTKPSILPDRVPYPVSKEAARQFFLSYTVRENENMVRLERIAAQAALIAADLISRYRLDELLSVNHIERESVKNINAEIKSRLNEEFKQRGLTIHSVGVGFGDMPEEIRKRRIAEWQGNWKGAIDKAGLGGLGKSVRILPEEEAKLQLEVLEEIYQNVQTLRLAGKLPMSEEIAKRLERIITDAATEGLLRTLIPPAS